MCVAATPPRQILVATDLSERAGMAVTRAAQVSREHGALLTALLVPGGSSGPWFKSCQPDAGQRHFPRLRKVPFPSCAQ